MNDIQKLSFLDYVKGKKLKWYDWQDFGYFIPSGKIDKHGYMLGVHEDGENGSCCIHGGICAYGWEIIQHEGVCIA